MDMIDNARYTGYLIIWTHFFTARFSFNLTIAFLFYRPDPSYSYVKEMTVKI